MQRAMQNDDRRKSDAVPDDDGALDLSVRRYSVETTSTTPSPHNERDILAEAITPMLHNYGIYTSPSTSPHTDTELEQPFAPRPHASLQSGAPFDMQQRPVGFPVPPMMNAFYNPFYHHSMQLNSEFLNSLNNLKKHQTNETSDLQQPLRQYAPNPMSYSTEITKREQREPREPREQREPGIAPEDNTLPVSTMAMSPKPVYDTPIGRDAKLPRPFKAYPRESLSLSGELIDTYSEEKFVNFRKRMLEQIHQTNGGRNISNPKMRRVNKSRHLSSPSDNQVVSDDQQQQHQHNQPRQADEEALEDNDSNHSGSVRDQAYYERRKKNNAAAKKSRDRRRNKEDEIAIRATYLERENLELKLKIGHFERIYGVCPMPSIPQPFPEQPVEWANSHNNQQK